MHKPNTKPTSARRQAAMLNAEDGFFNTPPGSKRVWLRMVAEEMLKLCDKHKVPKGK